MGRSRGGLTTKVHLVIDGAGVPVKLKVTTGCSADCTQAKILLKGKNAAVILADKGYDTNAIIRFVRRRMKAKPVIPPKRNRKLKRRYDKQIYKARNLIERAFNKLKHWRRIATRYDRCDPMFIASISLASIAIWA